MIPPTMHDVGQLAGCHPSTVSLALRGDSRISPETQERVKRAADELGYKIHPFVSALVGARRAGKSIERRVALSYLSCLPEGFSWRSDQHFGTIYEGAKERAEQQGYSLDALRVSDYQRDISRLNKVLLTRNVQGIIVGPTLVHHNIEGIEWSKFSLVTIGYGLQTPALHRVTEDHHLGLRLAFESCLEKGYRKIAMALNKQHNAMRRERWLGAYLYEQYSHLKDAERLPVCEVRGPNLEAKLKSWVREHDPDVVLVDDIDNWKNIEIPSLGIAISESYIDSGVFENNLGIGRHAADLLVSLVLRNERGLPLMRQTVLVEPSLENSDD